MKRLAPAAFALALALAAPAAAQDGRLNCGGTEPFWGVEIGRAAASFSTPEGGTVALTAAPPRNASGRPADLVRVYDLKRADGRGAVTLVVTRHERACSDGMSDRAYPYHAVVVAPERVMMGCCRWMP